LLLVFQAHDVHDDGRASGCTSGSDPVGVHAVLGVLTYGPTARRCSAFRVLRTVLGTRRGWPPHTTFWAAKTRDPGPFVATPPQPFSTGWSVRSWRGSRAAARPPAGARSGPPRSVGNRFQSTVPAASQEASGSRASSGETSSIVMPTPVEGQKICTQRVTFRSFTVFCS